MTVEKILKNSKKRFMKFLNRNCNIDAQKFSEALKSTGALVAGGSVLATIRKDDSKTLAFNSSDLDIYVKESQAESLIRQLLNPEICFEEDQNYPYIMNVQLTPVYDGSFMRKNNIIFRTVIAYGTIYGYRTVDIMVIPDNVEPKTVVTNFDLTICEIWYDGEKIETYPGNLQKILDKKGTLRDEYLDSFLKYSNKFIENRLKKYTKRGFEITYREPGTVIYGGTKIKNVQNPNEWVASKIYRALLNNVVPINFTSIYSSSDKNLAKIKWLVTNSSDNYNIKNIKNIIEKLPQEQLDQVEKIWNLAKQKMDSDEEEDEWIKKILSYKDTFSGKMEKWKCYALFVILIFHTDTGDCLKIEWWDTQVPLTNKWVEYINNFFEINVKYFDSFLHRFEGYRGQFPNQCLELPFPSIKINIIPELQELVNKPEKLSQECQNLVKILGMDSDEEEDEGESEEVSNKRREIEKLVKEQGEIRKEMSQDRGDSEERNERRKRFMKLQTEIGRLRGELSEPNVDKNLSKTEKFKTSGAKNLIFVIFDKDDKEETILCLNTDIILPELQTPWNWLVECTGEFFPGTQDKPMNKINLREKWVGITFGADQLKFFIDSDQLQRVILDVDEDRHKVFYLSRIKNEDGELREITHTQNLYLSAQHMFRNMDVPEDAGSLVSANHCQNRSGIPYIYDIKV